MNRRDFLKTAVPASAFAIIPQSRPQVSDGVQIGDPLSDRAIV
jgi:phosphodiesterase/alkaline phosphatase D-like protein